MKPSRLDPKKRQELAARLRQELGQVHTVERLADGAIYLATDGGELEQLDARADRALLLQNAKAGLVPRLVVEGVTFIQRPKSPNRNYARVKPAAMQALASSFAGAPVLRDHDTRLDSRAGTILESKLERVETPEGTEYRIRQRLELVKQWAIVAVLDGTLDRWSISFGRTPGAKVLCSVHETPVFSKCYCWRGDQMDDGRIVEFLYTSVEGLEVSGVSVPAVVGTSIDSIGQLRAELHASGLDVADLASMLESDSSSLSPHTEKKMHELALIAATLGLAAGASVDDCSAAIRTLQASRAEADTALGVARASLEEEKAARVVAETALAVDREKAQLARRDDLLVQLKSAGKVAPGSKLEAALLKRAESNYELFEAEALDLLESGAQVTPAGAPRQTPEVLHKTDDVDEYLAAHPHVAASLKKAGITKEQFAKHGLPKVNGPQRAFAQG
jgi:hypothetical protein